MYYSRDKGTYFTSPGIVPAIPTLSEFFFSVGSLLYQKKALPLHHDRANGTFLPVGIQTTSSEVKLLGANKETCLSGKISGPIAQLVRAPDS